MRRTLRNSDLIARLSGDEFVVLLTGGNRAVSEEPMAHLEQAAGEHNRAAQRGYDISFSHGMVEFDHARHHSIEDLLAAGDETMYRTKQQKDHSR